MTNTVMMDLQEYNELLLFKETLKRDNEELMTENIVLKERLEECKVKNSCTPDRVVASKEIKNFKVKLECKVDHDRLRATLHDAEKMIEKAIYDSVTVTLPEYQY